MSISKDKDDDEDNLKIGAKVFKKGVIVKNNVTLNENNNGDEDDLKGEIVNNNVSNENNYNYNNNSQ